MTTDVKVNVAIWAVADVDVDMVNRVFGDTSLEMIAVELHRLRSRTTALEIDHAILLGEYSVVCPDCNGEKFVHPVDAMTDANFTPNGIKCSNPKCIDGRVMIANAERVKAMKEEFNELIAKGDNGEFRSAQQACIDILNGGKR